MKTFIGAIALCFAVPALAQAAPAPDHKSGCCERMKAEGKECCCKDMANHESHAGKQDQKPRADGDKGHHGHEH